MLKRLYKIKWYTAFLWHGASHGKSLIIKWSTKPWFAGNPIEGASKDFNSVTLFVRKMVEQGVVTAGLIPIKHIDYWTIQFRELLCSVF